MTYLNDQVLKNLKEARKRKGLSQRALSAKSGVPQSHISKIESGAVDLRVSSLIALARVLDLELELVPRKAVSAVKSIVRSSNNYDIADVQRHVQRALGRYEIVIANISRSSPVVNLGKELESLNRARLDIELIRPNLKVLDKIVSSRKTLENALKQRGGLQEAIKQATEQLKTIRNIAVHSPFQEVAAALPAYRLDEVDDE